MIEASIPAIQSAARDAWLHGKTMADNPYPAGTDAHRVWSNEFAGRLMESV